MHQRRFQLGISLLVGLTLLLVSCGRNSNGPGDLGTLALAVRGVSEADVIVANSEGTIFEGTVKEAHTLDLQPGTYFIDGKPMATRNLLDPSVQEASVKANQVTQVILVYQTNDEGGEPSGTVGGISLESVVDADGTALPHRAEVNRNKDVALYAAQTEEAICVRMTATDDGGNPVANARVSVNIAEDTYMDDRIAITRGCGAGAALSTSAFRDDLMTDAEGVASFTLYASLGTDSAALAGDVARIVLSTENGDGSNVMQEFKLVPYNVAHLYFNGEKTNTRVGATFHRTNIFDANDRRGADRNRFTVDVGVYSKQPETLLDVANLGFVCFFVESNGDVVVEGFDDTVDLEKEQVLIDPPFPGTEPVETCYRDFDGSLSVRLDDSLRAEDMPVKATIHAVLYTEFDFGDTSYFFPLKAFTVTKTWVSTLVTIDKHVDHHVLTWYGDNLDLIDGDDDSDAGTEIDNFGEIDYTLDPANAVPQDSVFTANFTIKIKNEVKEGTEGVTAFDVTLRDELPAELGVIEKSFTDGGTYNSVNHAVTWYIGTLEPGQEVERTFQVYLRQKPGFCVDEEDLIASLAYSQYWTFGDEEYCYDDPYRVINGDALRDVTVAYFPVDTAANGGSQVVTDFNGSVFKDQVVIYGVRPLFDIDKVLINADDLPFDVGFAGIFGIRLENYDRTDATLAGVTANGFEVYNEDYGELADWYPDEFDGTRRDNPYARDVNLSDLFLLGLDYTHAEPLLVGDDEGVRADQSYNAVFIGSPDNPPPGFEPYLIDFGDKAIAWESVPVMGGGDTGMTTVKLNNNLPGFHLNLAALTAGNMNQGIDLGDCAEYDLSGFEFLAENELGAVFGPRFSFIVDCAPVEVLAPDEPWLELSGVGNGFEIDEEVEFRETVIDGEEFFYIFYVENFGDGTADDATLVVELGSDNAEFRAAAVFAGPNGGPYAPAPIDADVGGGRVEFGPYDHPAGVGAYFVILAEAEMVGNATATATVDWDASRNDAQAPLLPYSVTETVSIKPRR